MASSYPSPGRSVFFHTEGGRKKTVPHLHEQAGSRKDDQGHRGRERIATRSSDFFSPAPVSPVPSVVGESFLCLR